jgi:hypothetical protein
MVTFLSNNSSSLSGSVQQNQNLESKIQRRPSRTRIKKPDRQGTLGVPASSLASLANSGTFGSTLNSVPLSTSLGPSSSHGPHIFLKIRVEADTTDAPAVHISTTIPVWVVICCPVHVA